MNESYLVTGATGFVGSCLVYRLIKLGKRVHVISRKSQVNWRLKSIQKKIMFHTCDLRDDKLSLILEKINPMYVFHLAAYGSLQKENDIDRMMETNVLGTVSLVRSLDFNKVKLFVNTGSSAEYAIADKSFKENDTLLPTNDYGVSKVAQTLFCQKEAIQRKLPIITMRLFSPYGFFEEQTRLVPHVINRSIHNQSIELSNKTFVRDFIFVEDVADAYLHACKSVVTPGEIFNIGSGKQYTIENVVNEIRAITGTKSHQNWGGIKKQSRQFEPKIWHADITKAKERLRWKPKYSLKKGLEETVFWFRNNQHLYAQ